MIWVQQNSKSADENSISQEAIVLNSSVIIDGQMIYYSGKPEDGERGVYAMYADGSERIKLSDIQASLKAVSNGNLLLWHYDDNGYAMLEVLRMDGSLEKVGYGNAHAIARDCAASLFPQSVPRSRSRILSFIPTRKPIEAPLIPSSISLLTVTSSSSLSE